MYKGILEGLACELSIVTESLAEAVGDFEDIYVTGGGARSAGGRAGDGAQEGGGRNAEPERAPAAHLALDLVPPDGAL